MAVNLEQIKVTARKRAIGPKWGYEVQQPLRAMHGVDIEREIECQIAPVTGPMKWKRHDDEGAILRRLLGW